MSRTNETRLTERQETFKCKYRLDASFCNTKQRWNDDKCRYECKKLIDKWICVKGLIWNPSNCKYKFNKSCDVGEYLDYESCKCEEKLNEELVEQCTENIVEAKNVTLALYGFIANLLLQFTLS